MFCPRCGKQIDDGATFCPSCGSPLQGEVRDKPGNDNGKRKSKKTLVIGLAALVLVMALAGVAYGVLGAGKTQDDPIAGTWTASMKSADADGSESYKGEATLSIKDSNAEVDAHFYIGAMEFWGKIRGSVSLQGVQDGARVYSIRAQEAEWHAHDAAFSSDEIVNAINAREVKLYVSETAFSDYFGAGGWGFQIDGSTMMLALSGSAKDANGNLFAQFGDLLGGGYGDWASGALPINSYFLGSWASSVQKSLFGETSTAHIELSTSNGSNPASVSVEVVKK